jgi:hypothetical protein
MNSLLKPELPVRIGKSANDCIINFEKKLSSINKLSEVKSLLKKLKYLGLNYDPFHEELSPECSQILEDLELSDYLTDPYQVTNILLKLLDLTEEKLDQLKI